MVGVTRAFLSYIRREQATEKIIEDSYREVVAAVRGQDPPGGCPGAAGTPKEAIRALEGGQQALSQQGWKTFPCKVASEHSPTPAAQNPRKGTCTTPPRICAPASRAGGVARWLELSLEICASGAHLLKEEMGFGCPALIVLIL